MSRGSKIGIWILVFALIAVIFGVTAVHRLRKENIQGIKDVQQAEGIPVDIVVARTVPLEDWREFAGVAEGFEQISLMAPFRTRVQTVHVAVGDEVTKGDVLVSLDPYDPARFAMNLTTAQTQYETARQDSIRMEALYMAGAVSQQDLDHIRAATEAAWAQYKTARRAVELDTPISGVVTSVTVESGDYAPGEEVLVTVASYDRVRIPLELSDSERRFVQAGQSVRLFLEGDEAGMKVCTETGPERKDPADPSSALKGIVSRVSLSADPVTRLFPVEVVVENTHHRVQPGTLVAPEILVASMNDQAVLPAASLVKQNGREVVYILEDAGDRTAARSREVSRGVVSGGMVAIMRGVSPGDRVVVWGQNTIEDQAKVRVHHDRTAEYYQPLTQEGLE